MNRRIIANGLSLSRILLAPPTAYSVVQEQWLAASLLIALAMLTDMTDGPVARSSGATSAAGGLLDHSCDAFFVSTGLLALAFTHSIPLLLPVLVVLSFGQYVLDSKALSGRVLRTSVLGRSNGIAYFVLLGIVVFPRAVSPTLLAPAWITLLAWLLILSTLVSMADRLWSLLTLRRSS